MISMSMNWSIGYPYELVEKGGAVYELGTLLSIQLDDTLVFKKADGEVHIYRMESNVSYRYKTSGNPPGYSE